ncbi:hypothetical protein ABF179_002268 [Flavobacterium psychrophilum]
MKFLIIYFFIGFLANFIGPLANHLNKEARYALKENINKSWFNKYSLIFAIRFFMTLTYPLFYINYFIRGKKPIEPISFEDKINTSLVKRLRELGKYNNTAPTENTSDEKVIEIYTLICSSFRKASKEKQEQIPANNLNTIAMKFFKVYEEFGEDFMHKHLKYELDKYLKEGLRLEYQKGISLF